MVIEGKHQEELGDLSNPARLTEALDVAAYDPAVLASYLRTMLLIRRTEEVIGEWVERGQVRCPCHLGIGQEAVAVGISAHLRRADRIFSGHRSHSHYLAAGGDLRALLAEVLGKEAGCSHGMGGSMHLVGRDVGFMGSVPIVGGTIPIAVGAGLACKMEKIGNIAVTYFGDGSTEEGVFHESLNLAARYGLPVLFVCENNLYASHLDIKLRQPSDRIARFAEAHKIPAAVVDGNDVIVVAEEAAKAVERLRGGEGPAFIEAVTYRWRGHVGPQENIDVGLRRKPEDLLAWKGRDPIRRLAQGMTQTGSFCDNDYKAMVIDVEKEIQAASMAAEADPYPPASQLLDLVYPQ